MSICNEKKISKAFIFINLLYITQGAIPIIDPIYKLVLFLILAFSMYYAYKVNKEFGYSKFIKALNVLVLLITIYGILHILEPLDATLRAREGYRAYTYITNAYRPLLQIYPLYYFSRKGYLLENDIRAWIPISFIVVAIAFYVKRNAIIEELALSSNEIDSTNNMGHLVVTLIPMLFFIKKPVIKYALLAIVIVLVFSSAKRGAIIISALASAWFVLNDLKTATKKEKIWTIGLIAIAGIIMFRYLMGIFEESDYMQFLLEKTMEGDSSGRDVLFDNARNHFLNNSSLFEQLFGNGADSTYNILGNRAHNDWLEFLINQGVIGLLIYLHFWLVIFRYWIKSWHQKYIFKVLGSIVIIFFFRTFVSMLYNDLSPIACMLFAWCLANIDELFLKSKNNNVKNISINEHL